MAIELTSEQRRFIEQEIASGTYADERALLADALDLLRQRKAWVEKVQAGVKRGRDDIAAGRAFDVNGPEDAQKLREEISRRAKERQARRNQDTH